MDPVSNTAAKMMSSMQDLQTTSVNRAEVPISVAKASFAEVVHSQINNLRDSKCNMLGIKITIVDEINSFVTQSFSGNDISRLFIVGCTRKLLKVVVWSENMKSAVLFCSSKPANFYVDEYLNAEMFKSTIQTSCHEEPECIINYFRLF